MTISAFNVVRMTDVEYSKYTPEQSLVTCRMELAGTFDGTDTVTIGLVEEKTGLTIATTTLTPAASANPTVRTEAVFDLTQDCNDPAYINRKDTGGITLSDLFIYRAKQGWYHLALSATNASGTVTATATSPRFAIMIFPVKELKEQYLNGVALMSLDVLAPVIPPVNITGIEIQNANFDFYKGLYTLKYTASTHSLQLLPRVAVPTMPPPVTTLDPNGAGLVTVQANKLGGDYLTIKYDGWDLPTEDETDILVIDAKRASDEVLRKHLFEATEWLEKRLACFLEPTRVTTDRNLDAHVHYDKVLPTTYIAPSDFGSWINFQLTQGPVLVIDKMEGRLNASTVIPVPDDWRVVTNRMVQLVPDAGAPVSWLMYGPYIIQYLYFPFLTIPRFWHWSGTVGLPSLDVQPYGMVREYVAKRALVNILPVLGRAYQGGVASESNSKDGVSSSRNYTGGGKGLFSAEIEQYSGEIMDNTKRLRDSIHGIISVNFA